MTQRYTDTQIERFKREAKTLSRARSFNHSHPLDLIAQREGFANWSLLAKHATATTDAPPEAAAPADSRPGSVRRYLHGINAKAILRSTIAPAVTSSGRSKGSGG